MCYVISQSVYSSLLNSTPSYSLLIFRFLFFPFNYNKNRRLIQPPAPIYISFLYLIFSSPHLSYA
nr:MAG TPA: hypothetical protein [Bacteriophage sp.]